jgi:ABC-type transport system involved in cytochrome c biogenesis permease component
MNATVETQKPVAFFKRAWRWLVDANPVLAREILVTSRTPAHAAAIAVAPILVAGIVLAVRWTMTNGRDSLDGGEIVLTYLLWMAVFLGALGAIVGSTLVVPDRENGTLEALRFSRVRAGSIARAKLASVMLAQFAIVACTGPLVGYFVATSNVSLAEMAMAAAMALALGALTASVGIGVSAHAPNTRVALVVSLLGAGLIWISASAWLAFGRQIDGCLHDCNSFEEILGSPFRRGHLALLVLLPACGFAIVFFGGIAAAISGLLDRCEDRSLPIKRWGLTAVALVALVACAAADGAEPNGREAIAGVALFVMALGAVALHFAFVGEPLSPSRRIGARPSRPILQRLFPPSLVPSIGFTTVIGGLGFMGIPLLVRSPQIVAGLWVLLYVTALGGFMGLVAATKGAPRARCMGVIATPVFLLALLPDHSHGAAALDCLCPFWLRYASDGEAAAVWSCSLALWGLTACVMLGLMVSASRKGWQDAAIRKD